VSEQQANAFNRKMELVKENGATELRAGPGLRRTAFTEAEVNSWFAYDGRDLLPAGVTGAQFSIVGRGRVAAEATVDLEALAKQRATGGALDPWTYLSGRVPVKLNGVLHTQNGVGRFEVEDAAVSGIPIPSALLQDMVSYYSRTADDPGGVRLDDSFRLPARIKQIELGPGQAVVVQ
jgi:hypothetical protein